jgi:DNA polymerase-1
MLAKLRAGLQPTHVVVVWDGGMDCDRLAMLPEYKAHRPEMPSDLAEQIDGMMEFLRAAGIASVCIEGVEADDWIGCVARAAEKEGWEVVIASADKDFLQLVSLESGGAATGVPAAKPESESESERRGWIGLINPNDKSERIWGVADVRNKTGVSPTQVLDWLSLLGDAVDGIPGVPGVGAKTAAGLLNSFTSVDGLYDRLAEVKSERVREGLRAAEKDVRRNQSLVALK